MHCFPPNTKLLTVTGSFHSLILYLYASVPLQQMIQFTHHLIELPSMDQQMFLLFLLLATLLCQQPLILLAQPQPRTPTSNITVQGSVFCDPCHNNTFSRHSFFLPGVDVHIRCKLRANSPRTNEEMEFSVNRTTNIYGIYKLDIPSLEGIDCIRQPEIKTFCQVSLKRSSSLTCNIPGLRSTTNEITLKSKRNHQCIYSMSALSYRTLARNATICGNTKLRLASSSSFNASKCFFPYLPPSYNIPWPQLPPLPALPSLPPLPSFPFSPLPPLPSLPPLPPLPSLPPLPPLPSWPFPQPPNPKPPPSPSFPFPPFPNFPQPPPPTPPASNNP